ncbi:MAG: DUF3093 domain-containing protein [Actinomycetales bacterium]|nr:DUF3093 domain-containing protein [Actinomycetales bacterium]
MAPLYRERLAPGLGVLLPCALIIPAVALVFVPINAIVGIALGVAIYLAVLGVFAATTPTVEVSGGVLRAGRASIPVALLGAAHAYDGDEARAERGTRLDARAWLLLRGWVRGVVRIELDDPADPTPYWLVSSRRGAELAAAVEAAKASPTG